MTRGRLIWPFLAEIEPIDTTATEATDNYDHRFREPRKRVTGVQTRYGQAYKLPCQVETEIGSQEELQMMLAGDSPKTLMATVHHFDDLEDMGMVDAAGKATIRKNDKLKAIYTIDDEKVEDWCSVPLYCVMAQSRSFGLSSLQRNLLVVFWRSRDKSTRDVS